MKSSQRGDITIWAIVGIVVLIALVVGLAKVASGPGTDTKVMPTRTIERGAATSTVTLVEYGDFQCPACKTAWPLVETLYQEFGSRVHFVWRQYPLRNLHKNGNNAALAAEAAWHQGKFWEMYNMLYENQEKWSEEGTAPKIFEGYAEEIGLDLAQYKQDVASPAVKLAVDADVNEARAKHIPGTPSFLLNGEMIKPGKLEEFRGILNDALLKAGTDVVASTTLQLSPLPVVK